MYNKISSLYLHVQHWTSLQKKITPFRHDSYVVQKVQCSHPFSSGWFRFLDCFRGFVTLVESHRHFCVRSHVCFLCDKHEQKLFSLVQGSLKKLT